MFVAGPPVVARHRPRAHQAGTGRLGDPDRSGAVDHAVDTEEEAFAVARRFLSYLPSSIHSLPPMLPATDDPQRARREADDRDPARPAQGLRMRPIIETLVDQGSFFEIG